MNFIQKYSELQNSLELLNSEPKQLNSNDVYEYVAMNISPDFEWLAVGGLYIDNIVLWKISSQTQTKVIGTQMNEDLGQLEFSKDSIYLAACGSSIKIIIWKMKELDGNPIILDGHQSRIWRIQFFNKPLIDILCSGSSDSSVKIWNVTQKQLLQTFNINEDNSIFSVGISINNKWILIVGNDSKTLILDSKRLKLISQSKICENQLYFIGFPQHTCQYYACSGMDEYVRLLTKNKLIRKIHFPENWKWQIEFTCQSILVVSSINSILFWDISRGIQIKVLQNIFYTYPSFQFKYLEQGLCATASKFMIKLWIK
ncbi:unnamed protein product [Paramecium sonneborni]|uniref:WD40 repeat-containing protein n=1 Tax=Paramecium sonneborni TaxID=65129 RepID=A0A8S1QGJ4_9CILI|nr:unnamed protein product [Paramecium sonneborni]